YAGGDGNDLTLTLSPPFALGASNLLVGPGAGTNSVLLSAQPSAGPWTATANDSWLHLDGAHTGGTGSSTVVFTFDANPGATRQGTLTIAGLTVTVSQAGNSYQAASPFVALASSGFTNPWHLAVDAAGDVYIADADDNSIKKWTASTNTVTTL